MRRLVGSSAARGVVAVVIGVALLGGAFYAGRVYQNNADQKLFAEYNPAQSSGGRGTGAGFGGGAGASSFSASGGFGGSSQNAQVNAALSVGNPPSNASSTSGNGSSGASGSGTGGASTNGAGAGAAAGRRALTGQLVSATGGKLTVQSFLGQQSLPTTAQTRFFKVVSAAVSALAVGQRVAISPDPSDATTASSITIAPPGNLYVRVRSFGGNGGFGGTNGGGGSGNGGGFGSGGSNGGGFGSGGSNGGGSGSGGGFGSGGSGGFGGSGSSGGANGAGAGFGRGGGLIGTITSVSSGAITIKTAQGASQTIKRTAATTVYRAVPSTGAALKAGLFVSARSATVGGHQVAVDVVQASGSGAIASIVAGS